VIGYRYLTARNKNNRFRLSLNIICLDSGATVQCVLKLTSHLLNSAFHPFTVDKWVLATCRGKGARITSVGWQV